MSTHSYHQKISEGIDFESYDRDGLEQYAQAPGLLGILCRTALKLLDQSQSPPSALDGSQKQIGDKPLCDPPATSPAKKYPAA